MQGKSRILGKFHVKSLIFQKIWIWYTKTVSIKPLQDVLSLRALLRSQQALRFWQIMYFWYMSFPSPLYMNIFKSKHSKRLNPHYPRFLVWHFSHTFIRVSVLPSLSLQEPALGPGGNSASPALPSPCSECSLGTRNFAARVSGFTLSGLE